MAKKIHDAETAVYSKSVEYVEVAPKINSDYLLSRGALIQAKFNYEIGPQFI